MEKKKLSLLGLELSVPTPKNKPLQMAWMPNGGKGSKEL